MLSPFNLNFGTIPCGQSVSQTVTYYNNLTQDVSGVNVSTSGFYFSAIAFCPSPIHPGSTCSIRVTYHPYGQPGKDFGTLYVNGYPMGGDTASLWGACR